MKRIKEWLNKGGGGEWYEPYLTNKDMVFIGIITAIVCIILHIGCWLLREFYYL